VRDRRTHGVRVEARGWGWRHAGRKEWAVRGLDLLIEPGERVLLLGPSGSGKSTLIHAIAGLTGPDSALAGDEEGTLRVDGRPPREARARTGLLVQDPHTQIVMARVGDDVAFGLENRAVPPERIWPAVDAALARVSLPYGRNRSTAALSGGEKQRLVLAGALAPEPGLLLLDEPTAHLDRAGAAMVSEVLADLPATGATLVLVEHRVAMLSGLVDRIVAIEPGGGIVADGTPAQIFAQKGADRADRGICVTGTATKPEPRTRPEPRSRPEPMAEPRAELRPERAARSAGEPVLISAEGVRARNAPALPPEGLDLDLAAGTATAITGANGAGKSTLLSLLTGLARPLGGRVVPRGRLAAADRRPLVRWPARLLARHVGTVFQTAEHQFVRASVRDELRLGPLVAGAGEAAADRRTVELLDRLRLTHLADVHPFTLSGGEKRRLSVATALATEPDVLILDEPTFGQDARTWTELVTLMAGLRDSGRALALATHDDGLVDALADRELRLDRTGGVRAPA
jgi:energy-coupling factor transporter ATP-binding protein EcfA2